jgi:hypothetical protein
VRLGRPRLDLAAILGTLDDTYSVADGSPESPRRRTLVTLLGVAIHRIESADDGWDHAHAARRVHRDLGVAVQSLDLIDLLAEVVVRDETGSQSPTPAELQLHDRVREFTTAVRPALVLIGDDAAELAVLDPQAVVEGSHGEPQSRSDTMLDLMLAVGQLRELLEQRSDARLPADPTAREAAMVGVTLYRYCLERSVAALEALSDGDAEAAVRDLHAAENAAVVCDELVPGDALALRRIVADVTGPLRN